MSDASGGDDRTPRLSADCDPTRLQITPAQGYLLSRVDGSTPWSLLREIGGLPPEEVDRTLEEWLRIGVLELPDEEKEESPSASGEPPLPEARVDASLEIAVEIQRELLAFDKKIDQPYHELLGVPADATPAAIKKAYFALSRKFHPDRYFRRNLGPYLPRVERAFKRILEAYELLSDPTTRAELEKSLRAGGEQGDAAEKGAKPVRKPTRIAASMSLLAQHERALKERRRKAKNFFESGMSAFRAGRWLEAAASVRLSIAYDPRNEAFRDSFADVQRRAHDEQAKALTRKADEAWDMHDFEEAGKFYEEALNFRPFDAELCIKVARIAHQVGGDLRKAKELANTACEIEPDNAFYHLTLGKIFKAADLKANARREFETAMRLDPMDGEAKMELKTLR